MTAGSAAHVLLAWEDPECLHLGLVEAAFAATVVSVTRRRGWSQSVGERVPSRASVSVPVRSPERVVVAAVSVSGPVAKLSREPGLRPVQIRGMRAPTTRSRRTAGAALNSAPPHGWETSEVAEF